MTEPIITNHTAFTGVWVRRLICFHHRDPGNALSLALVIRSVKYNGNQGNMILRTKHKRPETHRRLEWHRLPTSSCSWDRSQTTVEDKARPTWITIIRLHMVNIPRLPIAFKNNCPIGRGSSDDNRSAMEVLAKDAAMSRIHPRISVAATPASIAIGAVRAAPATSSDMWAAASSATLFRYFRWDTTEMEGLHPVNVHKGDVNAKRNAHPSYKKNKQQSWRTSIKVRYHFSIQYGFRTE